MISHVSLALSVVLSRQPCYLWRTASGACRALGDADYKDPKPFVSAEASVRRLDLLLEDKAVIISADGLWDVIGVQDVGTMVDQLIKVHSLHAAT